MAVFFKSEINRRSSNEDSFCDIKFRVNHEAAVHAMSVADGMGGLSGGKYYSREAVARLNKKLLVLLMGEEFAGSSLNEQAEMLIEFLRDVFQEINQELYTKGLNAGIKGGTTLSVVIHFWHSIIIANCGDSPVYYMKDGQLILASDIQNAAWQMVKEGRTKEGSQLYYQNKTRLLQYLGRREPVTPAVRVLTDREISSLLMGTDGAFGNLTPLQIRDLVNDYGGQQSFLSELFELARSGGEEDNQTAIYAFSDSGYGSKSYVSSAQTDTEEPAPVSFSGEEQSVPGEYKKAISRIDFLKNRVCALKSRGGKNR